MFIVVLIRELWVLCFLIGLVGFWKLILNGILSGAILGDWVGILLIMKVNRLITGVQI